MTSESNQGPEDFSDVSLRLLSLSDVEDVMAWLNDDKVASFCPREPYTNEEEGIKYIKDYVIPHPWFRAICLNNKPVGEIFLTRCSECRGELSYVVASKYWGKGIATRAVRMVAKTVFSDLPEMERLEAIVDVDNVASQRVLEKAGFMKEGVLRKYFVLKGRAIDCVMFSFLSTDP